MNILVDVDNVVLNLTDTFLSYYNEVYDIPIDRSLKIEDITEWDLTKFVVPEAVEDVKKIFDWPDLFEYSHPVDGALEYINKLKNHKQRIIYVTANDPNNVKFKWLKQHEFLTNRDDFIQASDKSLIDGRILLDDNVENVMEFRYSGGVGILFDRPWNRSSGLPRVKNWSDFYEYIKGVR